MAIDKAMAGGGAIGCAIFVSILGALTYACSGSEQKTETAPANTAKTTYETQRQVATKRVEDLAERLERAQFTCEHGAVPADPDGSLALAEADVAMAKNVDHITQDEEWRIRAAVGREMGLPPSQVDGWRAIYQGRAERARKLLERSRRSSEESKRAACANLSELTAELGEAKRTLGKVNP